MIRRIAVSENVDGWKNKPEELLAFIIEQIWRAGINPEDTLCWNAKDGVITISSLEKTIEKRRKEILDRKK